LVLSGSTVAEIPDGTYTLTYAPKPNETVRWVGTVGDEEITLWSKGGDMDISFQSPDGVSRLFVYRKSGTWPLEDITFAPSDVISSTGYTGNAPTCATLDMVKADPFEPDNPIIIPTDKKEVLYDYEVITAGDAFSRGKYKYTDDILGSELAHVDNSTRAFDDERFLGYLDFGSGDHWYIYNPNAIDIYENTSTSTTPPLTDDWTGGTAPTPIIEKRGEFQYLNVTGEADPEADIENRGTQTVLTQIPIIVKPAYRLGQSST
jgi:hypothetical protein